MNQSLKSRLYELVINHGLHWLIQLMTAVTIYDVWPDSICDKASEYCTLRLGAAASPYSKVCRIRGSHYGHYECCGTFLTTPLVAVYTRHECLN